MAKTDVRRVNVLTQACDDLEDAFEHINDAMEGALDLLSDIEERSDWKKVGGPSRGLRALIGQAKAHAVNALNAIAAEGKAAGEKASPALAGDSKTSVLDDPITSAIQTAEMHMRFARDVLTDLKQPGEEEIAVALIDRARSELCELFEKMVGHGIYLPGAPEEPRMRRSAQSKDAR